MSDILDRLFKPLLEHDCRSQGHRIRKEGYCFYCGKEREEIQAEIEAGVYHFDAIKYLAEETREG